MDEPLHISQQCGHLLLRRGHENRIAGPCATNPVFGPTQLARLLACTARPIKQALVCLAQESHADEQPFRIAELLLSPIAASPNTGLQKPSQIMVDKPQTIPREKVGQMIGHLDYGIMLTVNRAMALFLGFA